MVSRANETYRRRTISLAMMQRSARQHPFHSSHFGTSGKKSFVIGGRSWRFILGILAKIQNASNASLAECQSQCQDHALYVKIVTVVALCLPRSAFVFARALLAKCPLTRIASVLHVSSPNTQSDKLFPEESPRLRCSFCHATPFCN